MLKRIVLTIMALLICFALNDTIGISEAEETLLPPLTDPGPYGVSILNVTFNDETRDDWEISTFILYPADKSIGAPSPILSQILQDSTPDKSWAPYPLIIYSHGWTQTNVESMDVKIHLASHGYIVISPQHHDTNPPSHEFVDRPLDIMAILDALPTLDNSELAGMIDINNVGLMGFSQGAEASLQMLGLLSNPNHYVDWCAEHPDIVSWDCSFVPLEATALYRTQLGFDDTIDSQWQPFGDERINGVFVMAPCDFPMTTENTLAMVTTPTIILHGTNDSFCDYSNNAVHLFNHMKNTDRYLLTLIDAGHTQLIDSSSVIQHFALAFFEYHLKNDPKYEPYLTGDSVPDLAGIQLHWGPYDDH